MEETCRPEDETGEGTEEGRALTPPSLFPLEHLVHDQFLLDGLRTWQQ